MPALSYYAAPLLCPHCSAISPDNGTTGMQHKLISEWQGATLRVGDRPDLTLGDFEWEYVLVRAPAGGIEGEIRVLHPWSCPSCRLASWAEIVFNGGTVESILDVGLTQASLDRAHFIDEDVYEEFDRLLGMSLWQGQEVRSDFARLLRERLPAS